MGSGTTSTIRQRFAPPFAKLWLALPLLLYALLICANPIGYVGGGSDDLHYLKAARCMAEQGWCVPQDHWAARWTLNAPLALSLSLIGDARLALNLVIWTFGGLALCLLMHLTRRLANVRASVFAGLLFVATPVSGFGMLTVNIDMPELVFLLAGVAAALRSESKGSRNWAVSAGIAFGLAFATRETAAATLLPLALIACWHRKWRLIGLAMVGAGLVVVGEALFHWLTTGDALLRFKLALGHTGIASTEMVGGKTGVFPLFNPDVIARWRPAANIDVHWLINPWINVLLHPWCRMVMLVSVAMAITGRSLQPHILKPVLAMMLISAALLIYGFAIDPKPRMFMQELAGIVIIAATGLSRFVDEKRALALTIALLTILSGLAITTIFSGVAEAEKTVRHWQSERGDRPTMDGTSLSAMALLNNGRESKAAEIRVSEPYRITVSNTECLPGALKAKAHFGGLLHYAPVRRALMRFTVLQKPVYTCLY